MQLLTLKREEREPDFAGWIALSEASEDKGGGEAERSAGDAEKLLIATFIAITS